MSKCGTGGSTCDIRCLLYSRQVLEGGLDPRRERSPPLSGHSNRGYDGGVENHPARQPDSPSPTHAGLRRGGCRNCPRRISAWKKSLPSLTATFYRYILMRPTLQLSGRRQLPLVVWINVRQYLPVAFSTKSGRETRSCVQRYQEGV